MYAADQGRFFTDFAAVYSKLVNTGARWGPPLQIRAVEIGVKKPVFEEGVA